MRRIRDGLTAGAVAALPSGIPSTLHALATGGRVLESTRAAGAILLPHERRTPALVAAAIPVHVTLSLGWGVVLALVLPRRKTVLWGGLAGIAIAALDLGIIGRNVDRVRALSPGPQIADHIAFGAIVGYVFSRSGES